MYIFRYKCYIFQLNDYKLIALLSNASTMFIVRYRKLVLRVQRDSHVSIEKKIKMIALDSSLRMNNKWQGSTAWHYTMANIIVLINSTAIYTIMVEKREKKMCA